jgi:hypothetical protein
LLAIFCPDERTHASLTGVAGLNAIVSVGQKILLKTKSTYIYQRFPQKKTANKAMIETMASDTGTRSTFTFHHAELG